MLIPLARSTALLAAGLLAAAAHAQAPAPPAACAAVRCTTATEPKLVLVPRRDQDSWFRQEGRVGEADGDLRK
jgi:ABC-type sugar transport system substrate-binding protein